MSPVPSKAEAARRESPWTRPTAPPRGAAARATCTASFSGFGAGHDPRLDRDVEDLDVRLALRHPQSQSREVCRPFDLEVSARMEVPGQVVGPPR